MSLGAPYLEYKFNAGIVNRTKHMVFKTFTVQTVTITFNTFGSPEADVTIYKGPDNNGVYELSSLSRVTATSSYISISDILLSDGGTYLITAANAYGESINNLTFDLIVTGNASLTCLMGTTS